MAKKQAVNGSFAKPKGCFSQISNEVLRNDSLSLKAKGLYSLIVSYITLPDFTLYKNYLQSHCAEGRYSFDSAWKELVEAGYLTHNRSRLPDGTFFYEYSLLTPAHPKQKTEDTVVSEVKPQEKSTTEKMQKISSIARPPVQKNHAPVLPIVYNTLKSNTKSVLSDKDLQLRNKIEKQIEYDYFLREDFFKGPKQLVITQLVDYLCSLNKKALHKETGEGLEGDLLLQLVDSVDSCTICEFLLHMEERRPSQIRFPVAYWNKAFLNYLKEEAYALAIIG